MVSVEDHAAMLETLGKEYPVADIRFVPDLAVWARQNGVDLSEPAQFMKLVAEGNRLILVVQSAVREDALDDIIMGLDVRWQVVDNTANLLFRFDSLEKKLTYCFLKEYARSKEDLEGDERLEDEWALRQMEKLGVFEEKVLGPGTRVS